MPEAFVEPSSAARISSSFPTRAGAAESMSATAPATCGAAMLVPLSVWKLPSGQAERTSTPGAEMSGFTAFEKGDGPRELKSAIRPPES